MEHFGIRQLFYLTNLIYRCTKFNADNVKRIISEMPESAGRRVQKAVIEDKDYHGIRPKLTPPSYFRTNDFTQPFQDIVETYGIPRYRYIFNLNKKKRGQSINLDSYNIPISIWCDVWGYRTWRLVILSRNLFMLVQRFYAKKKCGACCVVPESPCQICMF